MKREAILLLLGCSEVNSTWLITSELDNQRAQKALFTCVVYTNKEYVGIIFGVCLVKYLLKHRGVQSSYQFWLQGTDHDMSKIVIPNLQLDGLRYMR